MKTGRTEHQDTKLTSMRPRLKKLNDNPYINETFSKNKRNRKLAKTMSLATMVEKWMPLAKVVRTEDGIHHSCNFLVFEATYLDVTIEAKARDHGAYSILHTMRIKKLENPPERTANAADMSGLTNFSPQN